MRIAELFIYLLAGSSTFAFGLLNTPNTPIQKPFASQAVVFQPSEQRPWDAPPPDDSYDNQIFFRLATLLQHWPNTRYPSGSSIVPGTIPVGTTLYHGRNDAEIPSTPEWLALDPEHSALFIQGSNSRLFTFVSTRPLRILYFDGASGTKLKSGSVDTQNFLAWGHIGNQTVFEEPALLNGLCEWGKAFNIDGYVRMEMSFEIVYCNFYQGIGLVSSIHILPTEGSHITDVASGKGSGDPSPPHRPELPNRIPASRPTQFSAHLQGQPRPPNWKGALLSPEELSFEAFQAGVWHRRAPGEVRVRLDAARLVSLYDPALRSGAQIRKGLEKVQHRGKGLSQEDIDTFRSWVVGSVRPGVPATSGVDWPALTTVIMDRYGSRLEYLQLLLSPGSVSANATAIVQDVRKQLMIILMTDLTPDTIPNNPTLVGSNIGVKYPQAQAQAQAQTQKPRSDEWVKPILDHCSSYLVSYLPYDTFTREERTLYAAVRGTLHEVCRVLSLLWSEAYDPLPETNPVDLVDRWRAQILELMQWLDWPMWNKCTPECGLDSICFIPTWPMGVGKGPYEQGEEDLTEVDWTPKCVPKGGKGW